MTATTTVPAGECIFHSMADRVGQGAHPEDAVMLGVVIGVHMVRSGSLPPMCAPCAARFEAVMASNGLLLAVMSRDECDAVKKVHGGPFIEVQLEADPTAKDS